MKVFKLAPQTAQHYTKRGGLSLLFYTMYIVYTHWLQLYNTRVIIYNLLGFNEDQA